MPNATFFVCMMLIFIISVIRYKIRSGDMAAMV